MSFSTDFSLPGCASTTPKARSNEADTKLTSTMPMPMQVIFNSSVHAKQTTGITSPNDIVYVRRDIKGCGAFIHKLADNLTDFPVQVKALRNLANQCLILESDQTTIDATYMLATVTARVNRLRKELIEVLIEIKPDALEKLKKVEQVQAYFLFNLIDLALIKQKWLERVKFINVYSVYPYWDTDLTVNNLLKRHRLDPELAIEWFSLLTTEHGRNTICLRLIDEYLDQDYPEKALTLIRTPNKLLCVTDRMASLGKVIDHYLKRKKIAAMELLRIRKAQIPALNEQGKAENDLRHIKALWNKGHVTLSFDVAKQRITDIDPATKALKFPDLCFEFIKLVIHNPSENLSPQQRLHILQFMIEDLPDDFRKKQLLTYAKDKGFFSSSIEGADVAINTALSELDKRPFRLLKYAQNCIWYSKQDDTLSEAHDNLSKAFEVASEIRSPECILGFINSVLNRIDRGIATFEWGFTTLPPKEKKDFDRMLQGLPNELKYLLVLRNKVKPNPLLSTLEKEFHADSFNQEPHKAVTLYLKRFSDWALKESGVDLMRRTYLLPPTPTAKYSFPAGH